MRLVTEQVNLHTFLEFQWLWQHQRHQISQRTKIKVLTFSYILFMLHVLWQLLLFFFVSCSCSSVRVHPDFNNSVVIRPVSIASVIFLIGIWQVFSFLIKTYSPFHSLSISPLYMWNNEQLLHNQSSCSTSKRIYAVIKYFFSLV